MKKPKLTHTRRPMLFYQEGNGNPYTYTGPRLRIIFPDGKAMWNCYASGYEEFTVPCYGYDLPYKVDKYDNSCAKFPSAKAALKAMRDYDKNNGYPKADFLGYL